MMDFTVLPPMVVFLLLSQSHTGQLQVISPSQPIVALVGDDIILPCRLEPAIDVSSMNLEWTRLDLSPEFVYVRLDGKENDTKKHPSYRGRTSVSDEKLKHGDLSLNVSNVTVSDDGVYRCLVPALSEDGYVLLVVGAVSSPVISQMNIDSSVVVLQCESKGWYPEPEMSWLDGEGHVLSAESTETVRGPDGLYTVSSTLTVEKRHSKNITCRVQQRKINQIREMHIYISGQLHVIGPSRPIVALVGDDIILPCRLEPASDASNMTFAWARLDLSPEFVYVSVDGLQNDTDKHPSYRGRTSASSEKLKHGDLSLNIANVTVSDDGMYRCLIPTPSEAAFTDLVVGAVSSPVISQMNIDSSVMVLQCASKGWHPKPEAMWLDGEGRVLSAESTETVRGPDGLYKVSSRVTVEKRHSENITCRVQQKNINQIREMHIYISVQPRPWKWILIPVILSILLCPGLALACRCRKRR